MCQNGVPVHSPAKKPYLGYPISPDIKTPKYEHLSPTQSQFLSTTQEEPAEGQGLCFAGWSAGVTTIKEEEGHKIMKVPGLNARAS